MTIELPPTLRAFVEAEVESGGYADAGEVVAAALLEWRQARTQEEDEEAEAAYQAYLKREVAIGLAQADQGLSEPLDADALIREFRAEAGLCSTEGTR